jgi:hypothetical protein
LRQSARVTANKDRNIFAVGGRAIGAGEGGRLDAGASKQCLRVARLTRVSGPHHNPQS